MSDDRRLENDVARGAKAIAILQNPLIEEAFKTVEQAIHEQWQASPVRDIEGQHQLRLMLKALQEFKAVFELAVTDGNLARQEIKRLNEKIFSPKQWMGR